MYTLCLTTRHIASFTCCTDGTASNSPNANKTGSAVARCTTSASVRPLLPFATRQYSSSLASAMPSKIYAACRLRYRCCFTKLSAIACLCTLLIWRRYCYCSDLFSVRGKRAHLRAQSLGPMRQALALLQAQLVFKQVLLFLLLMANLVTKP